MPLKNGRANMISSIAFLEAQVLTHATENIEKVLEALAQIITPEVLNEIPPVQQRLTGHYKNPITLIKVRLENKKLIKTAVQNLLSQLSETEREVLRLDLDNRIDEDGCLYIRFNKQEAFLGKIRLDRIDSINVKMKLAIPRKQREKILNMYRNMILQS
jgi:RNA binding exosome subunit